MLAACCQVACGARHTLLLTQHGAAFATGWNCFGQLGVGRGDRASRCVAARVAGLCDAGLTARAAPAAPAPADSHAACSLADTDRAAPPPAGNGSADPARPGEPAGLRSAQGRVVSCAESTGHAPGVPADEPRVLDVAAGWWHSMFLVDDGQGSLVQGHAAGHSC